MAVTVLNFMTLTTVALFENTNIQGQEFNKINTIPTQIFNPNDNRCISFLDNSKLHNPISYEVIETEINEDDEEILHTYYIPYDIPNIDTSFKSYTDYRMITDRNSAQYEIRINCYTDDMGMRRLCSNDDYIIALGTYYTQNVGERFLITLDSGNQFYATIGDVKDNKDTDSSNRYIPKNGNVIEFHIQSNVVDKGVLLHGTVGYYDEFKGQVVGIERVVEE